jgi:Putative 2OG-Fe(II) oxygenase
MSRPAPHVVPIFATPFGVVSVPEAQALNGALAALFEEHASRESRAAGASSGPLAFRSCDDLLDWPEEPLRHAMRGILSGVSGVAASISDFSAEQFAALRLEARAWFTIVRPDGCVPPTNHPNSSWLGVYCVTAPPPSAARFDSGMLRLHECRPGTSFQDATYGGLRLPYRPSHCNWRPVPGEMAVFPAAITHEIAMVRGGGELMIVTVRARFASSGQPWMPPW